MTILILTHIDKQTSKPLLPHLEYLRLSNPDSDIHIIVGEDSEHGPKYNWKNSDQQLRNWWKINGSNIFDDEIIIIEWDTLITTKLQSLPSNLDLASKTMYKENISIRNNIIPKRMSNPEWTSDNWMWWQEVGLLELKDDQQAIGLVSFGFYSIRKWVLDRISDSNWDHIFAKSIQNELRFPTIASLCGARVGEIDLPNVEFYDVIPDSAPGIYHGVNKSLEEYIKGKTGPGTQLKKLLSYIGIKATPNCSCNHRANIMDYHGPEWCEQNIDKIIGWLKEEADKRQLLFVDSLARLLIKKAIKNSRKY